jgi:hypothetical protein
MGIRFGGVRARVPPPASLSGTLSPRPRCACDCGWKPRQFPATAFRGREDPDTERKRGRDDERQPTTRRGHHVSFGDSRSLPRPARAAAKSTTRADEAPASAVERHDTPFDVALLPGHQASDRGMCVTRFTVPLGSAGGKYRFAASFSAPGSEWTRSWRPTEVGVRCEPRCSSFAICATSSPSPKS